MIRIIQMRSEVHSRDLEAKVTRKKVMVPADLPDFEVDLEGKPTKCITEVQCQDCGKTILRSTSRELQASRENLGKWLFRYFYELSQHRCAKKEDKKK